MYPARIPWRVLPFSTAYRFDHTDKANSFRLFSFSAAHSEDHFLPAEAQTAVFYSFLRSAFRLIRADPPVLSRVAVSVDASVLPTVNRGFLLNPQCIS